MNVLMAIVKDEKPHYIEEWLKWHRSLFDQIVIYNNGGDSDFPGCHVIPFPGAVMQMPALHHALIRYRNAEWICHLDLDEFITGFNPKSLSEITPEVGCVSLNWLMFGSSGLVKADNRYQHEKFLTPAYAAEGNKHVKSFVRPTAVLKYPNPHAPKLLPGFSQIHVNGTPFTGPFFSPPDWTYGRIDHYYTRSFEEWTEKVNRGRADHPNKRSIDEFYTLNGER